MEFTKASFRLWPVLLCFMHSFALCMRDCKNEERPAKLHFLSTCSAS